MEYIRFFDTLRLSDVNIVGGKNASLGEMITQLSGAGITVPGGFATTAQAYWHFLNYNKLQSKLKDLLCSLLGNKAESSIVGNELDMKKLSAVGLAMRELIMNGTMPDDLATEIVNAYHILSQKYKTDACAVAVRSSATAEDLPNASFAGQQESYINISGDDALLDACKKCIASLFTDRAIVYRAQQGFDTFKIALSVGVQKMVHSETGVSGVAFSLDTETGFKDVVFIEGSAGLGESVVQGMVTPSAFMVHKPTLAQGFRSIIKKQYPFVLTDDEIIALAQMVVTIEKHYSELKGAWCPMDVEWAKDGIDGKLYIVQARPETVFGGKKEQAIIRYHLENKTGVAPEVLVSGASIGQKMVSGRARVITDIHESDSVQEGEIIVTQMTDPDWVPVMKRAAGIVTDHGGRTCHAAIVSRELGIPAVVGTGDATEKIRTGSDITIDCSRGVEGYVYKGCLPYTCETVPLENIPASPVSIMVNLADPSSAFETSFLPVDGVGLARIEFIISNSIKVHPMVLADLDRVSGADAQLREKIKNITRGYSDTSSFFVSTLAQGIGMIAAAFYPRSVIVRFSDFKSNEYRNLIGGNLFEPVEENPMLGLRGASRYYNDAYKAAFELECQAICAVRNDMGLKNVKVMVPFVRTIQEGQRVLAAMKCNSLVRGVDDLQIIMMVEIPSNVILIDEFCALFDGFSIGSNDLTQLTLAVDRDSSILSGLFDERDEAVKKMMALAIAGAHVQNKPIGICGQAPSDYPEVADFLIEHGIDYLSLNPDVVLSFLMRK